MELPKSFDACLLLAYWLQARSPVHSRAGRQGLQLHGSCCSRGSLLCSSSCPCSPHQFCWLLVFPCVLALCGCLTARREFALRLPRGAMPREERAWWAALAVPPLWQIMLLFMPAFSLAVYRIMAQVPLIYT